MDEIPAGGPPPESSPSPPASPSRWAEARRGWRRRLPVYLLLALGAFLLVQFFERRPRDLDVFFVVTQLEVKAGERTLDRSRLVEFKAQFRDEDELLATSTWTFRPGSAPMKIGPTRVTLRPGDYSLQLRLFFDVGDGRRHEVPLWRRARVGKEDDHLLIDVTG